MTDNKGPSTSSFGLTPCKLAESNIRLSEWVSSTNNLVTKVEDLWTVMDELDQLRRAFDELEAQLACHEQESEEQEAICSDLRQMEKQLTTLLEEFEAEIEEKDAELEQWRRRGYLLAERAERLNGLERSVASRERELEKRQRQMMAREEAFRRVLDNDELAPDEKVDILVEELDN